MRPRSSRSSRSEEYSGRQPADGLLVWGFLCQGLLRIALSKAASVPIFFRFRSHFGAPAWNTSAAPPRAARRKGAWAHRAARERSDELFRRPVRGGSDARYSRSCPNLTSFRLISSVNVQSEGNPS